MTKVIVNSQDARENYGEDFYDKVTRLFVDENYASYRQTLEEAYDTKDEMKMKIATHTLKSTSLYLGCESFSLSCKKIEDFIRDGNNLWPRIDAIWQAYLDEFEGLYNEMKKIYGHIYGVKETEPPKEVEKIRKESNNLNEVIPEEKDDKEDKEEKEDYECLSFRDMGGNKMLFNAHQTEEEAKKIESNNRLIITEAKVNAAKKHLQIRNLEKPNGQASNFFPSSPPREQKAIYTDTELKSIHTYIKSRLV